jgi:hypothetical protein
MDDIFDFDLLHSVKTPFFLGSPERSLAEADSVEVDASDQTNGALKLFYRMRALLSKGDMAELKSVMEASVGEYESVVMAFSTLLKQAIQGAAEPETVK